MSTEGEPGSARTPGDAGAASTPGDAGAPGTPGGGASGPPSAGGAARRQGDGWAAAHLEDLGEGPGFRKVRAALGIEAFGINAVVMPPGAASRFHYHHRQEELYFVHSGAMQIEFADGEVRPLRPGEFVRVEAHTPRRMRNVGDADAVYVCVGGAGGYVGRDGEVVED
jgi:mannose-6-phosphate isomerase-like protein (cupin superfamily)